MKKSINTKDMVITALMIAFGIIIPTLFKPLQVTLPPAFTATITAHVPIFISMCISPASAIFTSIGTTLGFLLSGIPLVVVARAASHIVFALVGAYMVVNKKSLVLVGIVTAVLHAAFEAVMVYVFFAMGWTPSDSGLLLAYTTGVGTLIHHVIDYVIAVVLLKALAKTKAIKDLPKLI